MPRRSGQLQWHTNMIVMPRPPCVKICANASQQQYAGWCHAILAGERWPYADYAVSPCRHFASFRHDAFAFSFRRPPIVFSALRATTASCQRHCAAFQPASLFRRQLSSARVKMRAWQERGSAQAAAKARCAAAAIVDIIPVILHFTARPIITTLIIRLLFHAATGFLAR